MKVGFNSALILPNSSSLYTLTSRSRSVLAAVQNESGNGDDLTAGRGDLCTIIYGMISKLIRDA